MPGDIETAIELIKIALKLAPDLVDAFDVVPSSVHAPRLAEVMREGNLARQLLREADTEPPPGG